MKKLMEILRISTLVLTVAMLASFTIAAMGAVIESVYLVYFWYLGLIVIGLIFLASLLGGLIHFCNSCLNSITRYSAIWNSRIPTVENFQAEKRRYFKERFFSLSHPLGKS